MKRALVLAVLLSTAIATPVVAQEAPNPTMVIVHGAWGGGWDWKNVDRRLRSLGWDVYRPTLTGLGERHHLASAEVGLDTHITDIVNVLMWEQLEDVVLVGHSYGGMVITGVVEQVPDRIRRLVYFDAMVPYDGECVLTIPGFWGGACGSLEAVEGQVDGLLAPGWLQPGTEPPSDVAHPAKTLVDPIHLEGMPGHGRSATYILTREAEGQPDGFDGAADRARELGWPVTVMIGSHTPYRDQLAEVVALLVRVAGGGGG